MGDDTYVVDNAGDIIAEATDEGFDQVNTTLTTFALGSNFEALAYLGEDAFHRHRQQPGYIIQFWRRCRHIGWSAELTPVWRFGDDTYYVDNVGDTVAEIALGGYDTVFTTVNFTLSAGVDELHFVGTGSFEGTGNDGDNVIVGGDGDDVITGGGGNDTL
ncbi:MAG: hypothetical protein IPP45_15490 [Sphingomonadales bacterium]|nr:hypothetical protein [Sphingomonadales bacterium]